MRILVVNKSTRVSNSDVVSMTAAVNVQARSHAAPAWDMRPPSVIYSSVDPGTPSSVVITVFDDSDQAGALGYHTEGPNGIKYGRVFAGPVLDNGGNALTAPLSVATVLSHEVLEALVDPACNSWSDRQDGSSVATEVGDPVEGDSYAIGVTNPYGEHVSVTVSNFVMPAWFDPAPAPGAQLDWMRLLHTPFEVRPSGYVVTMVDGVVSQQFGQEYPEWRKATKQSETSRTARRLTQGSSGSGNV